MRKIIQRIKNIKYLFTDFWWWWNLGDMTNAEINEGLQELLRAGYIEKIPYQPGELRQERLDKSND